MRTILTKQKRWLLPTVLIFFILEVITFPVVVYFTYSGRSESPDHWLTYTTNQLEWDSATGILPSGAAELSLFDAVYRNVDAENGEKVVAPGTENLNIIRLKNDAPNEIHFTAVLYKQIGAAPLPVKASLDGSDFTETASYILPDGVAQKDVVCAVTGRLDAGKIQDFDIAWRWDYYESDRQDEIDTYLGQKAANEGADDITVGFYLIVEDNDGPIRPEPPVTGDDTVIGGYVVLLCISGILLILLCIGSRREQEECEKS